jgi:hypothetical protein
MNIFKISWKSPRRLFIKIGLLGSITPAIYGIEKRINSPFFDVSFNCFVIGQFHKKEKKK